MLLIKREKLPIIEELEGDNGEEEKIAAGSSTIIIPQIEGDIFSEATMKLF